MKYILNRMPIAFIDFVEFVIMPLERLKLRNFDKKTKKDKTLSSANLVAPKGSSEFLITTVVLRNLDVKTQGRWLCKEKTIVFFFSELQIISFKILIQENV